MYVQRYLPHFPAAGEVVIFDRAGTTAPGVERVMGFCSEDEAFRFLRLVPLVERAMVDSGIILLKYWLEVGQEEQTRRIESRIDDPRKVWKLSPMDLKSYSRWYEYSRARDEMFAATNTDFAPWYVADSNDKKRARLNIISHLLEQIPYDAPKREPVALPAREKPRGYREPDHSSLQIPPGTDRWPSPGTHRSLIGMTRSARRQARTDPAQSSAQRPPDREVMTLGHGISAILTFAVGVAISPVPIIAVTLMLFSQRACVNGLMFLLG